MLDIDLIVQECRSGLQLSSLVLFNENSAVPISLTLSCFVFITRLSLIANFLFHCFVINKGVVVACHCKCNSLHLKNQWIIKRWHKTRNSIKWIVAGNRIRLDSNLR